MVPARQVFQILGAHAETEAKWLDSAGVAALEPALAGRFERGLYLPREGWLDNRALLAALEGRCGTIRFGECVEPADLHGNARSGGDMFVVDCRGVAAGFPNLRGVRGEAIRLHAPEVDLTRPVRLMHPRYQLYVAPRPGRHYVVGATQLESESTQATTVRSALELLSAAFALHPGFAEAEITELCAGLRPAYPDNLPRVEWKRGVLRVNGLYRHGFLIAARRRAAGHRGDRTMHVFVNGDRIRIDTDLLAEIVDALGFGDRKVVVAVNETFVAKNEWRTYQVRSEDRLDILSAMQGG